MLASTQPVIPATVTPGVSSSPDQPHPDVAVNTDGSNVQTAPYTPYSLPTPTSTIPVAPVTSTPASALTSAPANTYSTFFPPSTASAGLAETALASKDAYMNKTASDADALEQGQQQSEGAQSSIYQQLGLLPTEQQNEYESSGVNADQEGIDEINNEMAATSRSYDKQIEAVNANPQGRFNGGTDIVTNALSQQKASTLADQAIVLNARTNNFNTAKGIIDAKIAAETDGLKTQLQGLQYFYTQNAGTLSDDQKTLLQDKIDAATEEYQTATANRTSIGQIQLLAAQNGAPVSVVSAIGNSQTPEEAYSNLGSYGQNGLDEAYKKAQIDDLYSQIGSRGSGGTNFTQTQLNKGASNGGIDVATFKGLPSFDQNYFVNGYSNFESSLKQVNDGNASLSDLKSAIDSAGLSDASVQILYKKAGIDPTATDSGSGGFFSGIGSSLSSSASFLASLFGGAS